MFTPESFNKRVQEWKANDGVSPLTFPRRTAEEIAQRRVGEAEQLACELLRWPPPHHPFLSWWVAEVCLSPTYHLTFEEFMKLPAPEMAEAACRVREKDNLRGALEGNRSLEETQAEIAGLLQEGFGYQKGELTYPDTASKHYVNENDQEMDAAFLALASEVVEHRLRGEEGEKRPHDQGLGAIGYTTLMDAIARFHRDSVYLAARGRRTTLLVDRQCDIRVAEKRPLSWESERVAVRYEEDSLQAQVYLINKRSQEAICVVAVDEPIFEI